MFVINDWTGELSPERLLEELLVSAFEPGLVFAFGLRLLTPLRPMLFS